jgi:serine/threonine protein kinase
MAVRVLCPESSCGTYFEVTEDALGQAGRCPECGSQFVLTDSTRAETIAYTPRPSSPPRSVPTQFGRYEIVRKLGEGGMGMVFLAQDTRLDRPVALKVPHATLRDSPDVRERFAREAKTAARFHHPNFCPIHEIGQFAGWTYLAMAYVEGETLAAMIARDGAFPMRRAAAITRKLALAVQEAHDQGVVHRDLKPSNVMVNRRRELIIMDFGLARREGTDDPELTRSGMVMGSPHYMAPEQVRAEHGAIGPATDQYALGVIFYEMLTGRRPYRGAMALVLGLIATTDPDPPSKLRADLDPELEVICLTMMAREPSRRYASMSTVVAVLEAYLSRLDRPAQPATHVSPGASGIGPLPELDEIGLVPESRLDLQASRRTALDEDGDETGTPYELAAEPEASPSDTAWSGFGTPRPKRPPAKPAAASKRPRAAAARPRHGPGKRLLDLAYVLICVGVLAGAIALFLRWMGPVRSTIEIERPIPSGVVRIDGQVIPPEALERPIELTVGMHEVLLIRDDRVVATQRFEVLPGSNIPLRIRVGARDSDKD